MQSGKEDGKKDEILFDLITYISMNKANAVSFSLTFVFVCGILLSTHTATVLRAVFFSNLSKRVRDTIWLVLIFVFAYYRSCHKHCGKHQIEF
jgi:hypothetical protein